MSSRATAPSSRQRPLMPAVAQTSPITPAQVPRSCERLMCGAALRRPGDVLNWERAMFTDSNSAYLVTAPALAAAAAAAAVLPPVALRQLLSPFGRRTQ